MSIKLENQAQYDAKYDFVKFFLSILVVAIHSTPYPFILYPWLRVAVPLFFIMSSYFLFLKLRSSSFGEHVKILKSYCKRNAKLYVFWFVVLLPVTLNINRYSYFDQGIDKGFLNFLKDLCFGGTFFASWYITASIIGVNLVYSLSRKCKDLGSFCISVLFFCLVTLWSSYSSVLKSFPFISQAMSVYATWLGNPVLSFPASVFWIYIGKCFAEDRIKIPSDFTIAILLILSAFGLYCEWLFVMNLEGSYSNDSYFFLAPVCVCMFMCIQKIKPLSCRNSVYFRRASTVIYVAHGSIIHVIRLIDRYWLNIDSELVVFLVTLFLSLSLYCTIEFVLQHWRNQKIANWLKYSM